MKLSEFIKLTGREMVEYLDKINFNKFEKFDKKQCEMVHMVNLDNNVKAVITDGRPFGIEQDECGWEIIPWFAGTTYKHMDYRIPDYRFEPAVIIKKIPKYGELVYFHLSYKGSRFYLRCCCLGIGSVTMYEEYPLVMLEGTFENFNGLPFKLLYDEYWKDEVKRVATEHFNEEHFNDPKLPFLIFPERPNIYTLKTSKFRIDEYGKKVEEFAKFVSEHKDWWSCPDPKKLDKFTYSDWKGTHAIDKDLVSKSFVSLKCMFHDLTIEDFNNVRKAMKSNAPAMEKFLKKCKVDGTRNWDFDMFSELHGDFCHDFIYPQTKVVNFGIYCAIFARLDEFRKVYAETTGAGVDFTALYKEANAMMKESYKKIVGNRNKKMQEIALRIAAEMTEATETFNRELKELDEEKKKKYGNVLDLKKVQAYDGTDFSETVSILSSVLKAGVLSQGKKKPKNDGLSDEFRKHLKFFFDTLPERKDITYSMVDKAYDAPYEAYERNDDAMYGDQYDELAEAIGQYDADEWFGKFESFVDTELTLLDKGDCSDLYPGWTKCLVLTRDLDIKEVVENN